MERQLIVIRLTDHAVTFINCYSRCILDLPMSFCQIGFVPNLHLLDFTVVTLLGSTHIVEAGTTAGSAALSAEEMKHANNDQKCTELNWVCVPMAVLTIMKGCTGTSK